MVIYRAGQVRNERARGIEPSPKLLEDLAQFKRMRKAFSTIYGAQLTPREAIRVWKGMTPAERRRVMPERKGVAGYVAKKIWKVHPRTGTRFLQTVWVKAPVRRRKRIRRKRARR
jgi:hypothetical protein